MGLCTVVLSCDVVVVFCVVGSVEQADSDTRAAMAKQAIISLVISIILFGLLLSAAVVFVFSPFSMERRGCCCCCFNLSHDDF